MIPISPPTDNLYKFKAIAGLVLFILGAGYPCTKIQDLGLQSTHIRGDIRTLEVRRQALITHINALKGDMGTHVSVDVAQAKEVEQERLEYDLREAEILNKQDEVALLLRFSVFLVVGGVLAAALGIYLTASGFRAWKSKVQDPMDRALARDAA